MVTVPAHCQGFEKRVQQIILAIPPRPPLAVDQNGPGQWERKAPKFAEQINSLRQKQLDNLDNPIWTSRDYYRNLRENVHDVIAEGARYGLSFEDEDRAAEEAAEEAFSGAIENYSKRVVAAHIALIKQCIKGAPATEQLMVESMARQTPLLPEQAQLVNQFLRVKDPKRVYTDATTGTGTGVSVPRPAGRRTKKSKRHARKTRRRV